MGNATDDLTSYLSNFQQSMEVKSYEDDVRRSIVDYLPVMILGLYDLRKCDKSKFIRELYTSSPSDRAFLYGFAAHRLELDDGYKLGGIHIGASVLSSILSLDAEASWEDVVFSVVLGYEACGKLAKNIQPIHRRCGFHASGTCGAIGSACACSILKQCYSTELKGSISAASAMAAGLLEMQEDGSEMKPLAVGNAASRGLMASQVAFAGLNFPNDAIGGPRGLMHNMNFGHDFVLDFEGPAVIKSCYYKFYPSCRHSHSAIDAAIDISLNEKFNWSDIQEVSIYTYLDAILGHDSKVIESRSEAAMSTCFGVASALVDSNFTLQSLMDAQRTRGCISDLMAKMTVCEDRGLSNKAPKQRGARVLVRLKNGLEFNNEVLTPKGEPENPASQFDLQRKATSLLIQSGFSATFASEIISELFSWDGSLKDLQALINECVERVIK